MCLKVRMKLRMLENYISQKLFPIEYNRTIMGRWDNFMGTEDELNFLNEIIHPYLCDLKDLYGLKLSKHLDTIDIKDPLIVSHLLRIYPRQKIKGYVFYTLVPEERLDLSDHNLFMCDIFIQNLDTTGVDEMYWVWESGKYPDKPNLHLHLLVKFTKKSNNFARTLKIEWSKTFKGSSIDWRNKKGKGLDFKLCNTLKIQSDKIDYMENTMKGTHENFTDLKKRGHYVKPAELF